MELVSYLYLANDKSFVDVLNVVLSTLKTLPEYFDIKEWEVARKTYIKAINPTEVEKLAQEKQVISLVFPTTKKSDYNNCLIRPANMSSKGKDYDVLTNKRGWEVRFYIGAEKVDLIHSFYAIFQQFTEASNLHYGWFGINEISCVPTVPIAGTDTYGISTTKEEIEKYYNNVDLFLNSGWGAVIEVDNRIMCTRALEASKSTDRLKKIIDQQWQLARLAKANLCKYFLPQPSPSEHSIYKSGERTLNMVGYNNDTQFIEMSCALIDDTHINGWEIFNLWHPLSTGTVPSGEVIKGARITFVDKNVALREMRPLLDIGATVCYYDDDGKLVAVEQ